MRLEHPDSLGDSRVLGHAVNKAHGLVEEKNHRNTASRPKPNE